MKRHTRIITAQGDDGQPYSLYVYSDSAHPDRRMAPRVPMDGSTELATSDGHLVRWRAKGVYEIVTTGVVLRSAERDAP
jgi:hypothetical protein